MRRSLQQLRPRADKIQQDGYRTRRHQRRYRPKCLNRHIIQKLNRMPHLIRRRRSTNTHWWMWAIAQRCREINSRRCRCLSIENPELPLAKTKAKIAPVKLRRCHGYQGKVQQRLAEKPIHPKQTPRFYSFGQRQVACQGRQLYHSEINRWWQNHG